jgi:acetyl-CoA C-acetyltransferase
VRAARSTLSLRGAACIAGAYEHPLRKAPDTSLADLHAEVALGALRDAGLSLADVDGLFCSSDAPGIGTMTLSDHLGLRPRHVDSTDTGGSSPIVQVGHAAQAIATGRCRVALITLAGRPRSAPSARDWWFLEDPSVPEVPYELPFRHTVANTYAMVARRHMHEFGTTSEQLAWVKVAASHHAQHNPHAMLPTVVTVDDVLGSPMVADPLHRLDCCVVSDGGGALVVVHPDVAREVARPVVSVRGAAEAVKGIAGGRVDLTRSAGAISGPRAFAEAGVTPGDIRYASIYDSFTITVVMQLEDLGFCAKGEGGRFVADGALISGVGRLAVNTDGGGLSNNHPANRGGVTKVIEAVRQLRGEAHPAVQVGDLELALVHGTGGSLGTRHVSATLILERIR